MIESPYIDQVHGAYRVAGSRVSLTSIVYAFRDGMAPEEILSSFPVLDLERIYGALTFYLANREAVDQSIEEGQQRFEEMADNARRANADLYRRLETARLKQPA